MSIYTITTDTVFDTAECTVMVSYDTEQEVVVRCDLTSSLGRVSDSRYKWLDDSSYGMCTLWIDRLDIFAEVADSIKDKDWNYSTNWDARNPVKNENFRQALLKSLYTLADNFRDFVVDNLKRGERGGFEDLMDSDGWIGVRDLARRLREMNDISIPLMLLFDLPNRDNRFLAKGEYDFDTHEDTRKIKFNDR